MNVELLDIVAKVAACVCGKDGIISEAEEQEIFNIISKKYPTYSRQRFDQTIDKFFEESYQLEDYLNDLSGKNLKIFTVELCKRSASIDGLDVNENIAFNKVAMLLGVDV